MICNWGVSLVMICLVFLTGCVQQGATPVKGDAKAAVAESAIISTPGYYEDKTLGFSIKYHAETFSVVNELRENEVLYREGAQKVPTLSIKVKDIPAGVALKDIGAQIVSDFKKDYPASERFQLVESKMVKLETGMDANSSVIKWKYQGSVMLYTACVSAYKNGKVIYVFTTSVPGQPPIEILTKMAMALKVEL